MTQIHIGTFQLGLENVDLYALPEEQSGEFYVLPDGRNIGRIKVGTGYRDWESVVRVLMHEAMEYVCFRKGVRFEESARLTGDHGGYLFVFDHRIYGEIVAAVADFIVASLPKLAKFYGRKSKHAKSSKH